MVTCINSFHAMYVLTATILYNLVPTIIHNAEATGKEKVLGIAGFKVALPCNITLPTPNDELLLILWYRGDTSNPLYTMDARRGVKNYSRHSSSDNLSGRAYFSVVDRPAVLIIEPVFAGDAGTYKCRVDFRVARTRYSISDLSVIVPPNKPVITDVNENVLESLVGPYNEGDSLTLICESEGGEPPASVTWWRDSELLDDSFQSISRSTVQNILIIPTLRREYLMNTFMCQATNNKQSPPASTTVTIDMNFKPLDVWIENSNRPLSTKKPSKLICHVTGSRPTAQLSWWIGGKKLQSAKKRSPFERNRSRNKTTNVLIFKPSIDDNGKYLSCKAENPLIPGNAIETGWKLDVHYTPQLHLRLGSKLRHSHIQEGNDVYLDCCIQSNPPASEITWRFEGSELCANASFGIIISNQSLVLQNVKRKNRGRYSCLATNSEGKGESNMVFLRVQYKPRCKGRQRFLYGTAKNEAVRVPCEVDADPTDVDFLWKFNNSGHVVDLEDYNYKETRSVATYSPKTQYDYGSLLCWAKNAAGLQDIPCVFSIIPAGVPDPPQNCTIVNKSESSFRVKCLESFNGGLEQHFMIEVHDNLIQAVLINVTAKRPVFVIDGLSSGRRFLLQISSVNDKGRSQSVVMNLSTLHIPETLTHKDTQWNVNISSMLIILIGAVGGSVVMAAIIFVTMRYCKTKGQKTKEDITKLDKYEKAQHEFESFSSQNCPDIIPGHNQLPNSNAYENLNKGYEPQCKDSWPNKESEIAKSFTSRGFEMVISCPSSPVPKEEHRLLRKENAWPSSGKQQQIVEILNKPACVRPLYNKGQTEVSLLKRQTDI
ncbi:protein turtle-like isoform X2 [Tachypleus tridentatus]|uniref:protein turtle-like isoform X2 n=1 Tax=Tachypleus tridentatus TaxID=6853 RepID=UPI003FCF63EA